MINIAKEPAHGAVGLCPAGFALDSGRECGQIGLAADKRHLQIYPVLTGPRISPGLCGPVISDNSLLVIA
jgi:hypothetical protein